jgi:hypothetical protein
MEEAVRLGDVEEQDLVEPFRREPVSDQAVSRDGRGRALDNRWGIGPRRRSTGESVPRGPDEGVAKDRRFLV